MFTLELPLSTPETFSEAWELAWNNKFRFLSKANYELLRYRKHIEPVFGSTKLFDITSFTLDQFKNHLISKKLKAQTVTHILGLMRRTFNLLISWELYNQINPISKIRLPKADNHRHRYLTHEEAALLLEAIKEKSETTWRLSLLSLTTGMRIGEMLNLKGEHVDLRSETIRIIDPKNSKNRTVYLAPIATEMLKAIGLVIGQYVFKNSKGHRFYSLSSTFFRIVLKLGLNDGLTDSRDKVVFHSLRHTYASWLAQDGHSLLLLSELLGHSSLEMTRRYSHMSPEKKRATSATISRAFLSISENTARGKQFMESYA